MFEASQGDKDNVGFIDSITQLINTINTIKSETTDSKKSHILYTLNKLLEVNSNYIEFCKHTTFELKTYLKFQPILNPGFFTENVNYLFFISQLFVKELAAHGRQTTDEEFEIYTFYENNKNIDSDEKQFILRFKNAYSGLNSQDAIAKEWENRIESYRKDLAKKSSEYNYVNLSHAFSKLLEKKEKELRYIHIATIALGIAALFSPLVAIYLNFFTDKSITKDIANYFPFLACTVIFLYYFRIYQQSYNGIKSEILQIDQRKSLCAFVEGYSSYKKQYDSAVPDKFETLIFSPIVSIPGKIPSSFDGFDQITKLIKGTPTNSKSNN